MNKKGTSSIPQFAAKKEGSQTQYINKNATIMQGWQKGGDNANVFVSFRFIQEDYQCFSDWDKIEMRSFWSFLRKIHEYTWAMIFSQTRKVEKNGFALTYLERWKYPDCDFKKTIDPNVSLFELRVSEKARVHGFRDGAVYYICWLDKNHTICP